MSAPILWIIVPILMALFTMTVGSKRAMALTGGIASLLLALIALLLPIDAALRIGPLSLKISSTTFFLGRSLVLPPSDAPLLVVIFGLCAFWFFASEAAGVAERLVPFGLVITALLVGSIAVQPFLFASILIELAVLVALPMLAPPDQKPGRGVLRFLIYQTLGMPFILLAGWLLAGVETSPSDLSLTVQSTVMLGVGFVFLFAIFPLSIWIPQMMEECHPYVTGFLLWLLPSLILVFAMGFLDRYAWLRTSPEVVAGLQGMGLIMLVTGSIWGAFQDHFGRVLAYASISDIGFLLLAMSLAAGGSQNLVFVLMIPRGLTLGIWSLALSVLRQRGLALDFQSMRGAGRSYPWAAAGVALSGLSTAGFPLLAGFPPRLVLWEGLGHGSPLFLIWFLVGLLGLMVAAIRQIEVLVHTPDDSPWTSQESLPQRTLLAFGTCGLLILGVFPRALGFISGQLPLMFQHLGR